MIFFIILLVELLFFFRLSVAHCHLAVSAIYGIMFGTLVWPLFTRFSSRKLNAWIAGLAFGGFLFLMAQIAVLPITNSPLGDIPSWQWGIGHAIYGLVIGAMLAQKAG